MGKKYVHGDDIEVGMELHGDDRIIVTAVYHDDDGTWVEFSDGDRGYTSGIYIESGA